MMKKRSVMESERAAVQLLTLACRYNCLIQFSTDAVRLKYARNSFSLLVRVVDDLCLSDATEELLLKLTQFTHRLLQRGDLSLAR